MVDAFYGAEDVDLHNVDVRTDVSMAPTTFTRYTVAPSTASRTSKRSSRSKRKLERKAGSGRKGTVDEEEYLLRSVTKLVERLKTTQGEMLLIVPQGGVEFVGRSSSPESPAAFAVLYH